MNKNQRVLEWQNPCARYDFWGGMRGPASRLRSVADELLLTGNFTDEWLFDHETPAFEVWYISRVDEVWVYETGRENFDELEKLYLRVGSAEKALIQHSGQPLARWPCPDTPQELRTLCQMFYQLTES